MSTKKDVTFSSKFGTLAVIGGSVVGLGNIWRFPYLLGENGGSAFLIVYILCSLLIAIPIMMSEFIIGRQAKSNAFRSFRKLSKSKFWGIIGIIGIITVFFIFSFYSVIAGWAISFFNKALTSGFTGQSAEQIHTYFNNYVQSGWKPAIAAIVFVGLTAGIVIGGIEKGIERMNKILMPALVIIILGLFIYSIQLDGFYKGCMFLLQPDFSKISYNSVLAAIGQAFFSMSLGMGCMITYATYIKPKASLPKLALSIGITDLSVALLAGFAIFPIVFTYGIEPTSGPTLIFETLPLVFAQMPGGNFIGVIFFFLVFIAAITSSVSMLEPIVLFAIEELKASRKKAVIIISSIVAFVSVLCAYSLIDNSPIKVFGKNLFDFLDNATANFTMPIGALLIVIYIGWFVDKKITYNQLTNHGTQHNKTYPKILFVLQYFVPIVLAIFTLNIFGIL